MSRFEHVPYEMIANLYLNTIWKEVSFVYNILMITGILRFKKKLVESGVNAYMKSKILN